MSASLSSHEWSMSVHQVIGLHLVLWCPLKVIGWRHDTVHTASAGHWLDTPSQSEALLRILTNEKPGWELFALEDDWWTPFQTLWWDTWLSWHWHCLCSDHTPSEVRHARLQPFSLVCKPVFGQGRDQNQMPSCNSLEIFEGLIFKRYYGQAWKYYDILKYP